MQKFRLLLLDANIVIRLHELGLWKKVIEACAITLTSTVAYDEASFWEDDYGAKYYFDLTQDIEKGKIDCKEVSLSQIEIFKQKFDPSYLERLDPGEAESLTFLVGSDEEWLISSSDAIVFKVLGLLGQGKQGISMEEILNRTGLGRKLAWEYTKQFRLRWTSQGEQDHIRGRGTA